MAAAGTVGAEGAAAANGAEGGGGGGGIMQQIGGIIRMILIFQGIKWLMRGNAPDASATSALANAKGPSLVASPLWTADQEYDLHVYLSADEDIGHLDFSSSSSGLVWKESGMAMNWDPRNERAKNVTVPTWALETLAANESVYAHTFYSMPRSQIDPRGKNYAAGRVGHHVERLNVFRPRPKVVAAKNLLSGEYGDERLSTSMSVEEVENLVGRPVDIVNMWRPVLSIRTLVDFTVHASPGAIPPPLNQLYSFEPSSGRYWPVVYYDYFWVLDERFVIVNETVKELTLEMSHSPISILKLQLQLQMEESWKSQESYGTNTAKDTQEFKRMLMDTNPVLLGVTFFVSLLHMVFDFLAFKNDIQFWRQNANHVGLSVRTIVLNCVMQLIILLYLLDNDTSWMILLSSAIGLVIEVWKIRKAAKVTMLPSFPFVKVEDTEEQEASGSAQYDREAMRYLSFVLYPLLFGYAVYSLAYEHHKSWYSFIVGSLVGTVYTFGFIMMCPQLYMNYKLKSVAHLPWRMLTYKALNTFIDDLFAFIIKMPTLHRLSCFRDDIVFFIYLYQRWIYRVDYTRTNEFGLTPTAEEAKDDKKAAESPAVAGGDQSNGENQAVVAETKQEGEQPKEDREEDRVPAEAAEDSEEAASSVRHRTKSRRDD